MNISAISDQFKLDNVTVNLVWTPVENPLGSYSISVTPQTALIFNGSAAAQLTIPYNTLYNVSISAVIPCGQSSTAYIMLNYGEHATIIIIIL